MQTLAASLLVSLVATLGANPSMSVSQIPMEWATNASDLASEICLLKGEQVSGMNKIFFFRIVQSIGIPAVGVNARTAKHVVLNRQNVTLPRVIFVRICCSSGSDNERSNE